MGDGIGRGVKSGESDNLWVGHEDICDGIWGTHLKHDRLGEESEWVYFAHSPTEYVFYSKWQLYFYINYPFTPSDNSDDQLST